MMGVSSSRNIGIEKHLSNKGIKNKSSNLKCEMKNMQFW